MGVTGALPPARTPGHYAIEVVCLGNICRSPMADVVLTDRLAQAGLDDRVTVSSSGTGGWHVGSAMDARAAATLTAAGYDASRHRARQWDAAHMVDLSLAMDESNLADIGGAGPRTRKFRDFDPRGSTEKGGGDVPDPYYGGDDGFQEVLDMVERTAEAIVAALRAEHPWAPDRA